MPSGASRDNRPALECVEHAQRLDDGPRIIGRGSHVPVVDRHPRSAGVGSAVARPVAMADPDDLADTLQGAVGGFLGSAAFDTPQNFQDVRSHEGRDRAFAGEWEHVKLEPAHDLVAVAGRLGGEMALEPVAGDQLEEVGGDGHGLAALGPVHLARIPARCKHRARLERLLARLLEADLGKLPEREALLLAEETVVEAPEPAVSRRDLKVQALAVEQANSLVLGLAASIAF